MDIKTIMKHVPSYLLSPVLKLKDNLIVKDKCVYLYLDDILVCFIEKDKILWKFRSNIDDRVIEDDMFEVFSSKPIRLIFDKLLE